ncbi:hypothetical protein BDN70DRAFT_805285 [Pholiota conissans]|uniref:Trypsin-like peptidase domain-containing protein n=1 Tax=Pholiota conissans TaxID=109636 RepID=A0A9P5Z3G9_9AGAR|nr:hypothetical protein BDN70DRAFT_805285 [Pholiota conissans]
MFRSSITFGRHASLVLLRLQASQPRCFATVSSSIIAQPPHPPPPPSPEEGLVDDVPPLLDARVLQAAARPHATTIGEIVKQYLTSAGTVLDAALPYEPSPAAERRPRIGDPGESAREVVTVAHVARDGLEHKLTLASGFALNVRDKGVAGEGEGETLVLTCAHTLEEARTWRLRNWPLLMSAMTNRRTKQASGTFVVAGRGSALKVFPVSRVVSALPRSDLLLLSCALPEGMVRTLPVSPYPAHAGTAIRAHFVAHDTLRTTEGWNEWIGDTWGKWEAGRVVGYRDFAGRETEPGTYDALSHLLFTPLPTAGSSGGPIIDEETGAVVGVMLGTRMDSRVEGSRGWGVPAESIFEMFSLPGLEGKK